MMIVSEIADHRSQIRTYGVVAILTALGIAFQIGHFVEHAVQFGMWLFSDRSAAWMSVWAMWLVHSIGEALRPNAGHIAQMAAGMEVLHLIGNAIFLLTLAGAYRLMPSRNIRLAIYVEGFHLLEHLMLTGSVLILGKALGISTLLGYSSLVFTQEGMVGYRVFWHFAMNLVPSLLLMKSIMRRTAEA